MEVQTMLLSNLLPVVEQGKFFVSFGTAIWAFFSAYTYVKQSLAETKDGVASIKDELKDQTQSIVTATNAQTQELKGMRDDVRLLVQAAVVPPRTARSARRKKN